jgi:type IX secretion system PorP/SprF family membrane protein
MLKHLAKILFLILLVPVDCSGQETDAGPGYQTILMNNPAFAGSEGDATLRLLYFNYYPGNNYNLHSVYFSYDSYFPILHGGAGFYVSDDYLGGIVNDLRGGFSYSYFLQAGKDLYINAGLSGSLYHRGYNYSKAVFPDQIDALGGISFPSSDMPSSAGKTAFDVGVGFLFISGKFFGGFAIDHLTEPDISGTGITGDRLNRKVIFHLSRDFSLNTNQNLIIRPQIYIGYQKGLLSAGAGSVLESKYLSVNVLVLGNNARNINMQSGFSLKNGRVCIYYNYRFNIASGNLLMPFSLLHQTGLAFSLNNVDKRNLIKTINFPKL